MTRHFRALSLVALATVLVLASGCGGSDDDSSGSANGTSKAGPDKVSYITAFGAFGRDSFAWVAKEKGYFADAGIEVTIEKGAAVDTNLTALAAGKVQFAAMDFTGASIQAGNKKFQDWRAIAAIHQQTLVSIMTLEGTGITSPKDLAGKKVAAAKGSVNQMLFPAYAQLAGLDAKTVSFVDTQPTQLNALMVSGKVDALSTFLISQNALKKAAGGKSPVVFPYSDFLTDLFGNVITTTPKLAEENPDLVNRFRDAAMKGLKYAIEHPEEAAQILNKAEPTADVAAATSEIQLMTPYVTPSGGEPIGTIREERVARAIAILEGAGRVPSGSLKPTDVVNFDLTPKA